MQLKSVYLGVLSGKLTCSEVMQLLMEQPTKPDGRRIESHAHMHTTEGFRISPLGFRGDAFSLMRKRLHWENPTHLNPQGTNNDFGRFIYPSGGTGKSHGIYQGVFQDPDRLPPTGEYANRTGLGPLPRIPGAVTYDVRRIQPKAAPIKETYPSREAINRLTKTDYIEKNGEIHIIERRAADLAPPVQASPAHSMFPDSESMVMHLTGALCSIAGHRALHYMIHYIPSGEALTIGIFSKTAVRAVSAADTRVPNQLMERRLQVDQTAPRDPASGFYPTTGRVLTDRHHIDHVVVVLGHRASGDLNVITCYPSQQSTGDTVATATTPTEDIAEFVFGTHIKVPVSDPLPKLRW